MSEAFRLQRLRLKRVSLVNEPAQAPAQVVLFKSKELPVKKDAGDDMDDSMKSGKCMKCDKALGADAAFCPNCGTKAPAGAKKTMKLAIDLEKITDPEVKKAILKMAEDLEAAEALAEEEQGKRILAEKAAKGKDTKDDADVLKGLTPEARQLVEKAQASATAAEASAKKANDAILKMADEKRELEFINKAKAFGNLPVDAKKFGPVLKRAADGVATEADVEEIFRVLTAANKIAKGLFVQKGKEPVGDGGAASAADTILAKAKELRETVLKSGEKLSLPDAMDRVCRENPELYERHLQEQAPNSRAAAGGGVSEEE